jgi:putative ATP-dependent endonuclease of OLD family
MKLKKVIIKDLRSYSGENYIDIDNDFTTLIGKNDAGKSTILEALDIFFNGSKLELEDLCKNGSGKDIVVGCIFNNLPEDITVDTTAKTTLKDEYLLNQDSDLEIIKVYKCTERTISSKPEVFIRAVHPTTDKVDDLLKLKNDDLKNRGEAVKEHVTDKRQNNLWRKAIWAGAKDLGLKKVDLAVEQFEPKAKAIYTNIELLFPQFFLLKADRQATDGDAEAKDPMQVAVKEAQKQYQSEIVELENKIQERVNDVAKRALERLHEMDPQLAQQLIPTLKSSPKWAFDYRIEDDRGIPINKRGSGTRRLVLLNFFRAEAEHKSASTEGSIVYAIEEPETSQHPYNQKLIIDSLLDLSRDIKRQVVVSTHSPHLAERLPSDSIRFIEVNDKGLTQVHYGPEALQLAADSLGILSNQKLGGAKAVVVVEGEADDIFITHAAEVLAKDSLVTKDLKAAKVLILPAGGIPGVKHWTQRYRLEQLSLPYLVFIDSDRTSAAEAETKSELMCKDLVSRGKKAIHTQKREIENYIDPSVVGKPVTYGDYDDAKLAISTATSTDKNKVIEVFWQQMDSGQVKNAGKYTDASGTEKFEVVELVEAIIGLVED